LAPTDWRRLPQAIDLAGKPVLSERRARVQARQIFTYAVAASSAGADRGARPCSMLDYYIGAIPADGLFRQRPAGGRQPSPAIPHIYEQAFALLAIARGDPALAPIADTVREQLTTDRRGVAAATPLRRRPFLPVPTRNDLFEAALAWEQLSPDPCAALADEVASSASPLHDADGLLLDISTRPGRRRRPAGTLAAGHPVRMGRAARAWALRRGREDVRAIAAGSIATARPPHRSEASVAVFELLRRLSVNDAKRACGRRRMAEGPLISRARERDEPTDTLPMRSPRRRR